MEKGIDVVVLPYLVSIIKFFQNLLLFMLLLLTSKIKIMELTFVGKPCPERSVWCHLHTLRALY